MQSIKEKLEKSKWIGQWRAFWPKYGRFTYVGAIVVLVGAGAFLSGRLMMIFETRTSIDYVVNASAEAYSEVTQSAPQATSKPTIQPINEPKSVVNTTNIANPATSTTPGSYVASKTGKAYYFPWCAMVARIKDVNKVWFASKAAAEAAGYKPAANCHGLK